jgi:hypothetical protein
MSDDILTRLRRGYAFLRDQGHFITADACLAAIHEIQNLRAPTDGAEANGWRPIETAPKDGTKVLLRFEPPFNDQLEDGIVTGTCTGDRWWLSSIWASTTAHKTPTHWQPLPPAPARSNPPSPGESDER